MSNLEKRAALDVAVLGCMLILALASSGCRQVVGFDQDNARGKPDAGVDLSLRSNDASVQASIKACGRPYATTECADCAAEHCCPESSACAGEPACLWEASCLANCGSDAKCRAQCGLDVPVSQSSNDSELAACLASKCEGACDLGCGLSLLDYGSYPPEAARACHECIVTNACDEASACAASPDCDALSRCRSACRTPDCLQACVRAHEAGAELDLSLSSKTGMCRSACAYGGNWACVGHVSWPKPKSDNVTVELELVGVSEPLAGFGVLLCDRIDVECDEPLAKGKTGTDGHVMFDLRNRIGAMFGPDGYVRVIGNEEFGSFDRLWGFPLSERRYAMTDEDHWDNAAHTVSLAQLKALNDSIGFTPDPSRGNIVAKVHDCNWNPAPDVELTLSPSDSDTKRVYSTDPNLSATDGQGWVIFQNVLPGSVTVTATPRALGKPSSRQTFTVHAGSGVGVLMLPTP